MPSLNDSIYASQYPVINVAVDDTPAHPKTSKGLGIGGADLEFIGKQIFDGFENIGRAGLLTIGGLQGLTGDTEGRDQTFAELDQQRAVNTPGYFGSSYKAEMPTPDQLHLGVQTTGEVLKGLAPFIMGPSGGAIVTGLTTGEESVNQGIDATTATMRAALTGAGAAAMAGVGEIAGSGKTLLGTIGRQVAANVPTGMAMRAIDKGILYDKYPDIAKQIEIFGAKEIGLDVALGAIFGGLSHKSAIKEVMTKANVDEPTATRTVAAAEDVASRDVRTDDAVRSQQVYEQVRESNPLPEGIDLEQHMALIDKAISDLDNLRSVDLVADEPLALRPEVQAEAETLARTIEENRPTVPEQIVTLTPDIRQEIANTEVTIKTMDESGKVTETTMKAEEAIAKYKETDTLLSDILACVRGE